MAHALIDAELDEEFEKRCQQVIESRRKRGLTPSKAAPNFCMTRATAGGRYSKRLRQENPG